MNNLAKSIDDDLDGLIAEQEQRAVSKAPNATDEMGSIERFIAGAGRGMHNIGRTALGWTPESMGIQDVLGNDAEMDRLDTPLLDTTGGMLGNLAGEIVTTAPVGGGAVSMGGRLLGAFAPRVAGFGGAYGAGAARGVVEGAIESGMVGGDPMIGAGVGGGIGGAIPLVGRAWRGLGRPARPSREALEIERLGRTEGVPIELTAGQLADDSTFTGSLIKGVENTIDRVPGAGAILHAKEEAVANWNLAEIRAAMPNGMRDRITAPGHEGMEQARQAFNQGYTDALSGGDWDLMLPTQQVDDTFADIERLANERIAPSSQGLSDVQQDIDNLYNDMNGGRINETNVKQIESDIRTKGEFAGRAGRTGEAEVYRELLQLVRSQRDLAVGAQGAQRLHEIDDAYRKMAPIVKAGSMKGAVNQEFFTPSQLLSGGQNKMSDWGKATARNDASRRAIDAGKVFGSTIPQVGPGTAEKLATQSIIGGVGGVAGDIATGGSGGLLQSGLIGAAMAPALGVALPYMRNPLIGRTGAQQWMRGMQHPLDNIIEGITPWAIRGGVLGSTEDR